MRGRLGWLLVGVVLLGGCALQPVLPVEQAVARLVPGDPPGVDRADVYIGDQEILLAVEHWIKGTPVPRTGGTRLDDATMRRLIELWARRRPVR